MSLKKAKPANPKDLAIFSRQMALIFRSDITIIEGVLILRQQTLCPKIKGALENIHIQMEKGLSFAKAFAENKGVFPPYLINMVQLGEKSGNLDSVFFQMADYYHKEQRFLARLRSAAFYPLILLILMLFVILLLIIKVLPAFQALLLSIGGELPLLTRGLLGFGVFLIKGFIPIIIILALIIFSLSRYLKTDSGKIRLDKNILKLPALGPLNQAIITNRFALSMAMLIKSGEALLTSLKIAAPLTGNRYAETMLNEIYKDIDLKGLNLAQALEKAGVFPPLFIRMIAIGEKTGNLDIMLEKAAQNYSEETDDALEKFSATLEPALIIILSAIVAIILLSVMLPMISIISALA